ncbi:hypothetical protein MW887_011756 [Aspergillus wentii]|nr:hypothetical protein MW887_011756 [Aspergillus wentii]
MTSKFRIARVTSESIAKPRTTSKISSNAAGYTAWPRQKQTIMIDSSPLDNPGFLGPTSYQALINEKDQPRAGGMTEVSRTALTIEARKLDLGLQAASFLVTHFALLKSLVRRVYNIGRMSIIPESLMLAAVEHLADIFNGQSVDNEITCVPTVVRIFENSYQPMPIAQSTTFEEFCHLITGDNVRWETIGNVLVMASVCLVQIAEPEVQGYAKGELCAQMLEITDHVLLLCNELPLVNELMVCLKYNQMLLASQRWGHSSRWLCSSFGELSSCIFVNGMHQMGNPERQYPNFINQWRRRCFAMVYTMDKIFATIIGRPPFLNRHYCILDLPEDLSNEMNDHNFSSTFRSSHSPSVSYIHLRFLLSIIREEILELHLGTNKTNIPARASQIIEKLQSMWDYCPQHMKYSPDMWHGHLPCQDIWILFSLYLEYQYSLFLTHRLTAQDPLHAPRNNDLAHVAKEILSTILVLNDQRERLRTIRNNFSGVLLPFGLPTAQVLIAELFHQPSTFPIPAKQLPRSETIRELTLFVSCLGWATTPGTGHFEFGQTVQAKLTKLVDQLIEQSSSTPMEGDAGLQRNDVFLDSTFNLNSFVDWDAGGLVDPRFDFFYGSVL